RSTDPAVRVPRTANNERLSVSAASVPLSVIAARTMNQYPRGTKVLPVGGVIVWFATRNQKIPYAIQNDPHVPCIAVASASRARYAHIPAVNWATPPRMAANGNRKSGDVVVLPYHPARFAATMKVAAPKPKSPSTLGAATGWRKILAGIPSHDLSAPASPFRGSVRTFSCRTVLMLLLSLGGLYRNTMYPGRRAGKHMPVILRADAVREVAGGRERVPGARARRSPGAADAAARPAHLPRRPGGGERRHPRARPARAGARARPDPEPGRERRRVLRERQPHRRGLRGRPGWAHRGDARDPEGHRRGDGRRRERDGRRRHGGPGGAESPAGRRRPAGADLPVRHPREPALRHRERRGGRARPGRRRRADREPRLVPESHERRVLQAARRPRHPHARLGARGGGDALVRLRVERRRRRRGRGRAGGEPGHRPHRRRRAGRGRRREPARAPDGPGAA